MADRLPSFLDLAKYGITSDDVVRAYLGCSPAAIRESAIIVPVWDAAIFEKHVDSITTVFEGPLKAVWELERCGERFSLVRSGMTAAFAGDTVLALGCTRCEKLVFSGSVGGLLPSMKIGDFVIAESSVCGEGFSRYLEPEVKPRDCFFDRAVPDASLTSHLKRVAQDVCRRYSVALHSGSIFSTDSILAQFFRLAHLVEHRKCIGIEMETSATFKAAEVVGIRAAALLQVSDVIPTGKSLFSGRTEEEMREKKRIKADILPKVLLETVLADTGGE